MDADQVYEGVVYLGSKLVTVSIFAISWSITTFQLCYGLYPQATGIVVAVVLGYIVYRLVVKAIRSYLRMIWWTIKAIFFMFMVLMAVVVYIRGANFVENDIPYLQSLIHRYQSESTSLVGLFQKEMNKYVLQSFMGQFEQRQTDKGSKKSSSSKKNAKNHKKKSKNMGKKFQKDAKKVMNEYGIEVDESYLDYMNERFNPGEQDGGGYGDIMNNLEDTIGEFGIDLNQVYDVMGRFGA